MSNNNCLKIKTIKDESETMRTFSYILFSHNQFVKFLKWNFCISLFNHSSKMMIHFHASQSLNKSIQPMRKLKMKILLSSN